MSTLPPRLPHLPTLAVALCLTGCIAHSTGEDTDAPPMMVALYGTEGGAFAPPNRVAGVTELQVELSADEAPILAVSASDGVHVRGISARQASGLLWRGTVDFRGLEDGPIELSAIGELPSGGATRWSDTLIVDQSGPTVRLLSQDGRLRVALEDGFPPEHLRIEWLNADGEWHRSRGAAVVELPTDGRPVRLRASDPLGNTTEVGLPPHTAPNPLEITVLRSARPLPTQGEALGHTLAGGHVLSEYQIRNVGQSKVRVRAQTDAEAQISWSTGPWLTGLTLEALETSGLDPLGAHIGEPQTHIDLSADCGSGFLVDPQFWTPSPASFDIFGGLCEPIAAHAAAVHGFQVPVSGAWVGPTVIEPGEITRLILSLPPRRIEAASEPLQSGYGVQSVAAGDHCGACVAAELCPPGPLCQPSGLYFGHRHRAVFSTHVQMGEGALGVIWEGKAGRGVVPLPRPAGARSARQIMAGGGVPGGGGE